MNSRSIEKGTMVKQADGARIIKQMMRKWQFRIVNYKGSHCNLEYPPTGKKIRVPANKINCIRLINYIVNDLVLITSLPENEVGNVIFS